MQLKKGDYSGFLIADFENLSQLRAFTEVLEVNLVDKKHNNVNSYEKK